MSLKSLFHITIFLLLSLLAFRTNGYAQTIEYSIPLDDNIRNTDFDIIGNCGGNLMIYKKSYGKNEIAIYDSHLKIIDVVPMKFLPSEIKQTSFINFGDNVMMIYQYVNRRDIYCEAVMLDRFAKPLTKPLFIHKTTHPERIVGENAYATVRSDDKSKIMIFQILRNDDSMHFRIHTFLLDSSMNLLSTDEMIIPNHNQGDKLANFTLSNDGILYFTLGTKGYFGSSHFQKMLLFCRTPEHTSFLDSIRMHGHLLKDPVLLTLDEHHKKIWINSLNYDDKLRNIDYFSTNLFSTDSLRYLDTKMRFLNDSLKNNIRDKKGGLRQSFNNYQLAHSVIDKNGNALMIAEERYKEANGDNHYDNLLLFDLNPSAEIMQIQKIEKQQGPDLTDIFSSFLMINTGGSLHFLMNKSHRIFRFLNNYVYLLADYRYNVDHQLKEMPVMRGLDNKKRWAPRYGRQISRNEVVIPCVTGSSLIFGKITY